MNLNLTTSPTLAIELAKQYSEDKLELFGIEPLAQVNDFYKFGVLNKQITNDNLFKSVFGTGPVFFYAVEQVKNNVTIKYERGIGFFTEEDGRHFLNRKIPIVFGDNPQAATMCYGKCTGFECDSCEHIIVYSTSPITYAECLVNAHSIITSVSPFRPHSFAVENDSIVGRLDDSNVRSISINDKSFSEKLIDSISSFTKQIVLKCSKLDLKKLSLSSLTFSSSNKGVAKKGTIIYDNDGYLKLYTGTSWKRLVLEDDSE